MNWERKEINQLTGNEIAQKALQTAAILQNLAQESTTKLGKRGPIQVRGIMVEDQEGRVRPIVKAEGLLRVLSGPDYTQQTPIAMPDYGQPWIFGGHNYQEKIRENPAIKLTGISDLYGVVYIRGGRENCERLELNRGMELTEEADELAQVAVGVLRWAADLGNGSENYRVEQGILRLRQGICREAGALLIK